MTLGSIGAIEFILGAVIWLAVIVYLLILATRLVKAVEKIADKMGE